MAAGYGIGTPIDYSGQVEYNHEITPPRKLEMMRNWVVVDSDSDYEDQFFDSKDEALEHAEDAVRGTNREQHVFVKAAVVSPGNPITEEIDAWKNRSHSLGQSPAPSIPTSGPTEQGQSNSSSAGELAAEVARQFGGLK